MHGQNIAPVVYFTCLFIGKELLVHGQNTADDDQGCPRNQDIIGGRFDIADAQHRARYQDYDPYNKEDICYAFHCFRYI